MNTAPDKPEPYLTIKELSYALRENGHHYSRPYIDKFRVAAKFICGRVRYSDFIAALEEETARKEALRPAKRARKNRNREI